ncbi:MAG: acetylglutamate kinase [Spirochaetia bacterium]|nr:acetylglutamate kinase [Spirochaetota bacterium]MCX8097015.1 acetylglutamate kinase [Spirochaetota bacterium]MDW8111902.1 acetylglutamate kinase [Spirochaetia bacterium]
MSKDVEILIKALPYIIKFRDSIIVIKYGGSVMTNEELKKSFCENVVLIKTLGMHPVIVHGGGKKITELMNKLNKEPVFIKGQRVTDAETMEVVEMVLSGIINKDIVFNIIKVGGKAVGISGKDSFTIKAKKKIIETGEDLGFVGEVDKIEPSLILSLIKDGYIPVISPVGVDEDGNSYNINADDVTAEVAVALKADKLIYLTDVDGIYEDINNPETFISSITIKKLEELVEKGVIKEGMIPKAMSMIKAVERGVNKVHIINGTIKNSLLIEIFTDEGIGTQITI